MSHPNKDSLYAASCNPPRRAKRPRTDANDSDNNTSPPNVDAVSASAIQPRPILPKRVASSGKPASGHAPSTNLTTVPSTSSEVSATPTPTPVGGPAPSKRGRKPGPLSRSAREAQRRLNHSIIEKARRTKINDALATLKQLVPLDYGKKPKAPDGNNSDEYDDDADDDDDGDGEYSREKKAKPKSSGKKEEKEREYKLEILVRTVAFMQDLLQRVSVLEQGNHLCSNCGIGIETVPTRTKADSTPEQAAVTLIDARAHSDHETIRRAKRPRTVNYNEGPAEPLLTPPPASTTSQKQVQEKSIPRHRLPSISSWLPETLLDPSIFNVSPPLSRSKEVIPPLQLPTPPSSTQFDPMYPTTVKPSSTSPFASSNPNSHQSTFSATRTPDDESAASMLLHISGGAGSSPTFRPLPPSVFPYPGSAAMVPPPLPPSANNRPGAAAALTPRSRGQILTVQTPASLLGLITPSSA